MGANSAQALQFTPHRLEIRQLILMHDPLPTGLRTTAAWDGEFGGPSVVDRQLLPLFDFSNHT